MVGGAVLLMQYENEAEYEKHIGLHQWNFTKRTAKLLFGTIDIASMSKNISEIRPA